MKYPEFFCQNYFNNTSLRAYQHELAQKKLSLQKAKESYGRAKNLLTAFDIKISEVSAQLQQVKKSVADEEKECPIPEEYREGSLFLAQANNKLPLYQQTLDKLSTDIGQLEHEIRGIVYAAQQQRASLLKPIKPGSE